MKLQFNLSKEEATAFKNFFNAVNVNDNTEEEFIKAAFILGLRSMEATILENLAKAEAEQGAEEAPDAEFVGDDTEENAESTETEE